MKNGLKESLHSTKYETIHSTAKSSLKNVIYRYKLFQDADSSDEKLLKIADSKAVKKLETAHWPSLSYAIAQSNFFLSCYLLTLV